ncbi:MAG: ROK family protein [Rhodobacteraceae bacterium]|nr:ROK family protein [Paracoccaceae bacterium]MCF8520977.1 ROK family protein [Paracoccaceae bacterium]
MTAIGIDIGGTKIELQVFADDWTRTAQARVATPDTYPALIEAIGMLVDQAARSTGAVPLGISVAGLIDRQTGLALTSNLPANGKPLYADLTTRIGRPVALVNDCRAMALSEAHLGLGRGAARVLGLVLGTGIGSGFVREGIADQGASGIVAELGHVALPANVVQQHGLPILRCGCGRTGCYETLISGPGLGKLTRHLTGRPLTAPEVAAQRRDDPDVAAVWQVWCDLTAELLTTAILTLDPDVIVLGGGLSSIDGVSEDLRAAVAKIHLPGLSLPRIGIAQGGDASGARGAALAAHMTCEGGPDV